MKAVLLGLARRLCATPRLAAGASKIARERIVELRKVAPNDARVERAQDRLLRLAVDEKLHRRFDTIGRLGAELRPALGFAGLNRDAMPAFAARIAHEDVERQALGRGGSDGYCDVAHRSVWFSRSDGDIYR